MENSGILLAALCWMGVPGSVSAQEVQLVQFAASMANPRADAASVRERDRDPTLLEHMQAHFAAEPDPLLSAVRFMADADQHAWRGSRSDQQPIAARYSGSACDTAAYSPTWWLPQAAELRRARYFNVVADIACEHGLPTRLLDAVIAQESGYKSAAVSRAGAMGLMQIMPGTARLLGLAAPFDPVANMRAGARYLRAQLDRFGRVDLALAAYNAGPARRALKRGEIPAIPETLQYVRTITRNWSRLAQLAQTSAAPINREQVALTAIRAAGYREVEFVRYEWLHPANLR